MIAFIKRLIAVPIRLLAKAAGLVSFVDATSLWSAVWKLSHKPYDGIPLLMLKYKRNGIEAARQMAEEMLPEAKSCVLVSAIGSIEYSCHNFEAADKWIKMARDGDYKEPEWLLHLELFLSDFFEEYDPDTIIEQVLSRNDLPMLITLAALIKKANSLLEKQMWDQAEEIAERILSVQEQTDARLVKWVTCFRRGEQNEADEHFAKAQGKLPDAVFAALVAQGWLFMGEVRKAKEWLYKAEKEKSWVESLESPVGELARSDEFRNFCMEKESQ